MRPSYFVNFLFAVNHAVALAFSFCFSTVANMSTLCWLVLLANMVVVAGKTSWC